MTDRRVVRCQRCKLVQFEPRIKRCVRCNAAIEPPIPKLPAPPMDVVDVPVPPPENCYDVKEVSKRIRTYRIELDKTQAMLSGKKTHAYLSRIEHGHVPSIAYLEEIAERLELPIAWLLEPITADRMADIFLRRIMVEVKKVGRLNEQQWQFVTKAVKQLWQQTIRRGGQGEVVQTEYRGMRRSIDDSGVENRTWS